MDHSGKVSAKQIKGLSTCHFTRGTATVLSLNGERGVLA